MNDKSTDKSFAHLQELMDTLPAMREKGDLLSLALEAQHLDELERACQTCDSELNRARRWSDKARRNLESAQKTGDAKEINRLQLLNLHCANEQGFREAPAKNARIAYDKALAESRYTDEGEFRTALLPKNELKALAEEVAAYRADYTETLARCQKADDLT